MSDVEDIYPVTYVQGKSITVHMDHRDVIFTKRDKMYVADFSDWVVGEQQQVGALKTELSLMTVSEREGMYQRKDIPRALEAGEFLKSLGYPTQSEALRIVSDGNVMNVPYTLADIKRFFDIYGAQVPGLRGKTTKRHVSRHRTEDAMAKLQIMNQQLVADVVHVAGEKFLLSISSPLELLLVYHLSSLTAQELGNALQKHFNTLCSRGFEPKVVYVDPQSGLKSLQGSFPGIEIDVSRAGDHLDKLDTKTRRLKELMRSVVAGLPYKLKRDSVKDLVMYAVSRTNLKSTSALATNPTSKSKSNDILTEWTQPCIALYPSGNRNGSWVFWSLSTRSYVRRSQWKRLPVSREVIDAMNSEAGDYKVVTAVVTGTGIQVSDINSEPEVEPITTHVPKFVPELPSTDAKVQLTTNEFDNTGVPELGNFEDDNMSESGESEHGDQEQESDASSHRDLDQNLELLQQILEDSDSSFEPKDDARVPLRRSQRENAGKRTYDNSYEWNLMNLSVGAAVRGFGDVAKDAVKEELTQLFIHKKALEPVRWDDLNQEQHKRAVRSHMFLKEKYEDGSFVKMKARLVADGRMQDRTVYTDYWSPTAKTRSIMTCLKLAALKDWDMLKLDVGGAF